MSVSTLVRFFILAGFSLVGSVFANPLGSTEARAGDLTWGGNYRIEAIKIKNPELSGANSNKSYLLHHLVLSPKIIAADGLTIFSRLDVMNDPTFGVDPNGRVISVAGDLIGQGPGDGTPSNSSDSNVLGRTQRSGSLAITSLYLSWVQEFGQLVVGRTPIHFGLGTNFNAGSGLFDHYLDTKDLVGYKVVLGNFFIFPMLGKVSEGVVGQEDDVNDYLVHFQYDNPETDLSLGVLYQVRTSTHSGNDAPLTNNDFAGAGAVLVDGGKATNIGLFSNQKIGDFSVAVEANFLSGDTGVQTSGGLGVGLNAFGVAGEVSWKPESSKFAGGLKLGIASGDDPGTPETYEGFAFSRNYDVGLLMFNHPLGQRNLLRTGLVRDTAAAANEQIDSEALSNAMYVAPSLQYQWKDTTSVGTTLIYGALNKEPFAPSKSVARDLGFEVDFNITYKPFDRLTWVTEFAALVPGQAWKAGTDGLENSFAYGVITKAAISF